MARENFQVKTLASTSTALGSTLAVELKEVNTSVVQMEGPEEDVEAGGKVYKTMKWFHCSFIMLAETVSLGILSLPWALAQLGLVLGVLLVWWFGVLATLTAWMIGQFIRAHPEATSFAKVGPILFPNHRKAAEAAFAAIMTTVLVMIMAAHIVSFQIMMIELVEVYVCSLVWAFVGTVVMCACTLPRGMKNASILSILSSISVLTAVIMVMVDTSKLPNKHPGPFETKPDLAFATTVTAIMNIILSFSGHVAYFSFSHELKKPEDYNKAVYVQLGSATTLYSIVASVIFYNVGFNVEGLSLSSASPTIRLAAYGVASLTIVMAGVVNAHVPCKYFYEKYYIHLMKLSTFKARAPWYGLITGLWTLAFLLAILIPSFPHMLGFVSSLFSAFISYGLAGVLYFWYTPKEKRWSGRRNTIWTLTAISFFFLGIALSAIGITACVMEVRRGVTGEVASCQANRGGSSAGRH